MRPLCLLLALSFAVTAGAADDDVSLFDGTGKAIAYIAIADSLTVYLFDGTPVAYLESDSNGGYAVYGFNGKHLGWFTNGVIWDHYGQASCAVKDMIQKAGFEPFKGFKAFKPFKAFKEYAPFRPRFIKSFGDTPCSFLLGDGRE